jgi:hypothetical protein
MVVVSGHCRYLAFWHSRVLLIGEVFGGKFRLVRADAIRFLRRGHTSSGTARFGTGYRRRVLDEALFVRRHD